MRKKTFSSMSILQVIPQFLDMQARHMELKLLREEARRLGVDVSAVESKVRRPADE